MMEQKCTNCGKEVESSAKFCPHCGHPVTFTELHEDRQKIQNPRVRSLDSQTNDAMLAEMLRQRTTAASAGPNAGYSRKNYSGVVWSIILILIFIFAVGSCSDNSAESDYEEDFSQPVVSNPATGTYMNYTNKELSIPLKIITSSTGGHIFLKLLDTSTGNVVMTIFINQGQTAEILVPSGYYEVRYATGDIWYGEQYLFGPDTSYSAFSNTYTFDRNYQYTWELYEQQGGNLSDKTISKNEWDE